MKNQRHDSTATTRRGPIGPRLLGGFLPAVFAMAVVAAVPVAADSGGAKSFVQSHFELARGALEAEGSVGVLVSAMAGFSPPTGPDENMAQPVRDALAVDLAANWQTSD